MPEGRPTDMERLRLDGTVGVAGEVLSDLAEGLGGIFSGVLEVVTGGAFDLLPGEFDFGRRQYRAAPVLTRLAGARGESDYLLGVTEADLYVPGLNFIFGEADPAARCALISLHRLHPPGRGGKAGRELFRRRALVEGVHETGHLLLLTHCPDLRCVMHFSNSLADTDRKGPGFCDACLGRLSGGSP